MILNMSKRSKNGRIASGDIANISVWLVQEGLSGATQVALLQGFCERLVAAGIPLQRAHAAQRALHPVFGAVGFNWHRDDGCATQENYVRGGEPHERWLKSPFYYMMQEGVPELRVRPIDQKEAFQYRKTKSFQKCP